MKIIITIVSLTLLLSSCLGNSENLDSDDLGLWDSQTTSETEKMVFDIPSEYREISNSWAITVNGETISISGEKLKVWDSLTDSTLDMRADYFDQVETTTLANYPGIKLIETVPSLDTPVCTMQTKQLEFATSEFPEIDFLIVSNDTPFALQRFCNANGIDNLHVLSDARTREFGIANSLLMTDYSLLTRSIMIVDESNTILYIEYASEVTSELDLMNALAFLQSITK